MDLSILRSGGVIGVQVGDEWIDGVTDYKIISSADGTTELIIHLKVNADMSEFNVLTKPTKQN